MKKVHKQIFICVLIVVVLFAIFTASNVHAFYNEGVDQRGFIDEDLYQSVETEYTKRQALFTKDLKNALVSNVYIHEYAIDGDLRMQIKFRVSYYLPFLQESLPGTKLSMVDENGTDLGYSLSAYSDTVAGFNGTVFTLCFTGDDIPKPGEKINFSFTAEYMSGTIVIEIGG